MNAHLLRKTGVISCDSNPNTKLPQIIKFILFHTWESFHSLDSYKGLIMGLYRLVLKYTNF